MHPEPNLANVGFLIGLIALPFFLANITRYRSVIYGYRWSFISLHCQMVRCRCLARIRLSPIRLLFSIIPIIVEPIWDLTLSLVTAKPVETFVAQTLENVEIHLMFQSHREKSSEIQKRPE